MSVASRVASALAVALFAPPTAAAAMHDVRVMRTLALGHSAQGRAIRVVEVGDPDERRKLFVVGCIHGNEAAGVAIARALEQSQPVANADLWVVEDANPDGVAAGTRVNGRGVDLNRNFPWHWRPIRGDPLHNSGPRPLSEPESRLLARLILSVRPEISIWFHQALDVVDESGGTVAVERAFARAVGMQLARLPRNPGSVASWENHVLPHSTAFVVELHAGALTETETDRFVDAIRAVGDVDADG
jgi:murein peptide amidase A